MSKRLQVVFEEEELRELQDAAREEGVTLSAWVRRTLRGARAGKPSVSTETKLRAVRAAAQHRHPTANIEQMLAEVGRGYAAPAQRVMFIHRIMSFDRGFDAYPGIERVH